MAKTKQRNAKLKAAAAGSTDERRRGCLRKMKWRALEAGVIGAGGYCGLDDFAAFASERDLTTIDEADAAFAQIHDRQCPLYNVPVKEARTAREACADDALRYHIATIRTAKDGDFAKAHDVGHVTFVLLDGSGGVVEVLDGRRDRTELSQHFKALARSA